MMCGVIYRTSSRTCGSLKVIKAKPRDAPIDHINSLSKLTRLLVSHDDWVLYLAKVNKILPK